MSETKTKHFAIGLVVSVRDGAVPVGWPEGERGPEQPKHRQITEVWPSEEGNPLGSFMVGGWNWAPEDIEVV